MKKYLPVQLNFFALTKSPQHLGQIGWAKKCYRVQLENPCKFSRGEICVANFIPLCKWCDSGQLFKAQRDLLTHLGEVIVSKKKFPFGER